MTDEVQITVPPVQHRFHMPQVISAHAIAQLGLNNQEGDGQQGQVGTAQGMPAERLMLLYPASSRLG